MSNGRGPVRRRILNGSSDDALPKHVDTCAPVAGFADTPNPQDFARSKMGNISFDIYKKCVHAVRKCRHCHVIPLYGPTGEIVNYFVTHHRNNGQILTNTVGVGGIRPEQVQYVLNKKRAEFLLLAKGSHPEVGTEEPDSPGPEPPIEELTVDPQLQRLHEEHDSVISEPSNVEHLRSSMGSQFEQVSQQMRSSFSTPIVKQASRSLEQLILLIAGLQYDTSLEAIVLRCVQFLSAITEGGIVLTLHDTLMKYVADAKVPDLLEGKTVKEAFEVEQSNPPTPEVFSPGALHVWETLKQGIFTKHLSYILGTVFAFSACKIKNVKFSHPVYEKVIEASNAEEIDGMDLIDHCIKLYNWTSTVGMACLESRSLEPLLVNSSTLALCHEKYFEWQRKYTDFKRSGKSTMEERQLMFTEVEAVVKMLERMTKTQKEKFMSLQASSLYKDVLHLYNDVRDFVQKIDRVKVAMGYHITGPPKIGKSTIVPLLCEQICLARGVEYREQDSAQINLMAPYQDELNNATQTIVVNETVPIKVHLAKSVENAYNTALALVDPVPYHPNRSSLEEKSKNTMTHIGVISTGNTEQPFLHVAETPGAWERRYKIISMTVKAEYADEYGRFDSSKSDGSNDYHWFDVYEIVYIGKTRKVIYFEVNGKSSLQLDSQELFELVRKQSMDHFSEQDRLDGLHNKAKRTGCMSCKRLAYMCKCPNRDDHTLSGKQVATKNTDANSDTSVEDACPARTQIGANRSPCDFHKGGLCSYCGREEPDSDSVESVTPQPEVGVVSVAASTAGSLMWSSVLPWVNPFIKLRWLWSIDNNVMRCMHEELVEELSYWPETVGCTTFSLLPKSWTNRADGSLTFFGKKKEQFLRAVAAEKQIFLPLSYLARRAFCIGLLCFFALCCFGYLMEYFGMNPREYDQVVMKTRNVSEWGWYYFFPQHSRYVYQRRDLYAEMGIFTDRYLDFEWYYVNIYFFERWLGYLCVPWYFTYKRFIPVLETRLYQWWLAPLLISTCVSILLFFYLWWRRAMGYRARYENLKRRASSDQEFQRSLYERARRHCTEYNSLVPTALGVVGAIVTGLVIWNNMRMPEAGIRDDNRTSWNDWFNFQRDVPEPKESRNASADEAAGNVGKVLTHIDTQIDGEPRILMGMYLEPGILTLPRHLFKKDMLGEELVEYLDLHMETNGVKTKFRAYSKNMERIANKDAGVIFVPKAPSIGVSLKNMLPRKTGSDHIKSRLLYLQKADVDPNVKDYALRKTRVLKQEILNAEYIAKVDSGRFDCGRGLQYLSKVTKSGFCGSVLMADRRDPTILGFHISGQNYDMTSRRGFAQEITFDDYNAAVEKLKTQPHFRNVPEMKILHTTRLGIDLVPHAGPHPKTEMFEKDAMDLHSGVEVIGHTTNLPKYRSRVRRSMLSEKLETHCGWKCRWRAPYMKEPWKHHNKALKKIATGSREVPPDALRWASDDYWNQIFPALQKHISKHPELCRELTLDEAINGVKGSHYMKPFQMKTSAGIPNGDKLSSGLFKEIDPYEDGRKRYELTEKAQEYFDGMMGCFDRGERIGVYVRTCLKDEVVEEESEKVRIFYILECLFGLACRMYFLPIAEFISRYPLETECAVGINCAGPEWEALVAHINALATDARLNDWDFSGYDLNRPCDVTCTTLNTYERIGSNMSYADKSLKRMHGIGEELRNPLVNWNGTIMFLFFWCSGNTMTVYGNSTDNSLLQRISFYFNGILELGEDEFHKLGTYQENEHIATYGDDGHGGSKPEVRAITQFSSRKRFFDFVGVGFTNARKDGSDDEWIESEFVDFLKRKSVYHPDLGIRVGALDQNSIQKMGHMSHGSGEPEDLAIATIQTMLHEAFLHGDTFYEWLRTRLRNCATECCIWCKELDYSYSEKVIAWKEKYQE